MKSLYSISVLLAVFLLSAAPAGATSFTVNTTADETDTSAGDGTCLTASGACSLRAAVQEANALAGDDTVTLPAGTYVFSNGSLAISGNLTITGAGMTSTIIDVNAAATRSVLRTSGTVASLTISNLKLTGGDGTYAPLISGVSGIDINLNSVSISDNTGRGLTITDYASFSLTDSIINNNSSTISGAGIMFDDGGDVTITGSTISNNSVNTALQISGGGITFYSCASSLKIINSTVSGNTINSSSGSRAEGGGIYTCGTTHIYSSTITGNSSTDSAGGIFTATGGTIYMKNSIIAKNTATSGADCNATITSQGYNLAGDVYGCAFTSATGDQTGDSSGAGVLDPGLGALQNNGGATETHAITTASPAYNVADPAGCTDADGVTLTYDQRGSGYDRVERTACDIGAYELQAVCGDATVDSGEGCDDGNTANNDGCNSTCQAEVCGDGVVQTSEACDDGNTTGGDGCSAACVVEYCGDSTVNNTTETCDDGNTANNDGCNSTCQREFCGDGVLQTTERCDDGNTRSGDGCSASCAREYCGDGVVSAGLGENCDDRNRVSGDGCSNICRREYCGDGVVQSGLGEICDDGNRRNGDGCTSRCILE